MEKELPADAAPLTAPPETPAGASWEDDETRGTLFLRAAFVAVAGAFLLWTQRHAPVQAGTDWGRWLWASLLCNLFLPLGIASMLFGQGLSRLEWLKDQKHNAWSFGWNFRDWKRHFLLAVAILLVMLPLMWWYARVPEVRSYYEGYLPAVSTTPALLWLLASVVLYMFCWEWFFRGFLLFGMAQGFGFALSIILQAALFGLAHAGKPTFEMVSSFAGGALLGVLCWREKSFAPAFYAHALIHVVWILILLNV